MHEVCPNGNIAVTGRRLLVCSLKI